MPLCQDQADRFNEWATVNNMKINGSKSNLMLIDLKKTKTQVNDVKIGSDSVPFVKEMNLLGVVISSNLQWKENTKYIVSRASKRIFAVIKLKSFKASLPDLKQYYCSFIRPVVEYASTVWNTSLTRSEVITIEKVQKRFCKIVLGQDYINYELVLNHLDLQSLEERRKIKFQNEAIKIFQHDEHRSILPSLNTNNHTFRLRAHNKLNEPLCSTQRYKNSTIPQMTKYINSLFRN